MLLSPKKAGARSRKMEINHRAALSLGRRAVRVTSTCFRFLSFDQACLKSTFDGQISVTECELQCGGFVEFKGMSYKPAQHQEIG